MSEAIDTMALAQRLCRWNTELSTAPSRLKDDLDEALRPLLLELAALRRRLDAFETAAISDRQREIDDRAMRIVEDVASRSIGIDSGEYAYRRAAYIVRAAIDEREAQRAKREGTAE